MKWARTIETRARCIQGVVHLLLATCFLVSPLALAFQDWSKREVRAAFVARLKAKAKTQKPEDWYDIRSVDIKAAGGDGLLASFHHSPSALILSLSEEGLIKAPSGGWDETRFRKRVDWDSAEVRQAFVEKLRAAHGIKKPEDWYSLTNKQANKAGGAGLLTRMGGRISAVVAALSREGFIAAPRGGWVEEKFQKGQDWSLAKTRSALVERLTEKLGITEPEDWYQVRQEDFFEVNGRGFLLRYDGSPKRAIKALSKHGLIVPPEGGWVNVNFGKQTNWKRRETRAALVERIKEMSGVANPEDWYEISRPEFLEAGGGTFLVKHGSSARKAVIALSKDGLIPAPEGGWVPKKFGKKRKWLGTKPHQLGPHREVVRKLIETLKIKQPEDWYQVRVQDFRNAGGAALVSKFKGRPFDLVLFLSDLGLIEAPSDGWVTSNAGSPPLKWERPENLRAVVERLRERLKINRPEDWYETKTPDVIAADARGFLDKHNGSPKAVILALSRAGFIDPPEGGWDESLFGNVDWKSESARRRLVTNLIRNLDIRVAEDWYKVSANDFSEAGGNSFVASNGGSPKVVIQLLASEGLIPTPKGGWKDEEFGRRANWDRASLRQKLVKDLEKGLLLKKPEDWYRVSIVDIQNHGGGGLFNRYLSPRTMIQALSEDGYIEAPEGGWDPKKFYKGLKGQKLLAAFMESLLGREAVLNDRRSHGVVNPDSGRSLEADISFPDLKIAVEYQGPQHVFEEAVRRRDKHKRKLFPKNGWLLVEVWEKDWKRNELSTLETLEKALPKHPNRRLGAMASREIRKSKCLVSTAALGF